jgi:anti-anti-sigma factor
MRDVIDMSSDQASSVPCPPPEEVAPAHFGWSRRDLGAGVVRLSLSGELDLAAAAELDGVLHAADAGASIIVLDLDRLTFIDCCGARVLRAAADRAQGNGHRLVAVNPVHHVERWLRLMAVDRRLRLVSPPAGAGPT